MHNIFERFTGSDTWKESPWLIVGKGPSFSGIQIYDWSHFKILTLNDSIRKFDHVAIAHFIDFDAFKRSAQDLHRAGVVVLPWFPHVGNKPGKLGLADLQLREPMLQKLAQENRLSWYDLSTSAHRQGDFPTVSALYFSAEAAFDLLATAGVRKIRSLGIDGGSSYSDEFDDLIDVSLLKNRQKSFNRQFYSFAKIIARTGVDYAPLGMDTPIRVYVASSASEALPVKVLEYSIRQHASTTVEVIPLFGVGIPIPKPRAPENQPRTPFSFQRFLIPEVCGYAGRAIYLDSDMLVFKDITDLWCRPFGDANVLSAYSASASGRKPQYSVMLMDCSQLSWNIQKIVEELDTGALSYEQLMYDFSLARTESVIEPEWNSLEQYKDDQTALLHYTDMNKQPWVSSENPLGYLWVRTLRQAVVEGAISRAFIEDEVRLGHIRPSIIYQIDHEIDDAFLLPKKILSADAGFTPPYRTLGVYHTSKWWRRLQWLRASLRTKYQKTPLYRFKRRVLNRLKIQFDR
jgi:hypothetical protein